MTQATQNNESNDYSMNVESELNNMHDFLLNVQNYIEYLNSLHLDTPRKEKLFFIISNFYIHYKYYKLPFKNVSIYEIIKYFLYAIPAYQRHASLNEVDITNINENLNNRLEVLSINKLYYLSKQLVEGSYSKFSTIERKLHDFENKAKQISQDLDNKQKQWKLSAFAGSFDEIANMENKAKYVWLFLTIIFGIFATYFIINSSISIIMNDFNITLVEFLQKFANTILLYLIAIWCSRRYNICRAQQISYRHRAVILNSYDMFKNSTDKEEKNIIITAMANAIYTPPLMPNIKTIENSDFPQILELLKIATTKISPK